jgi:hypothetical protein
VKSSPELEDADAGAFVAGDGGAPGRVSIFGFDAATPQHPLSRQFQQTLQPLRTLSAESLLMKRGWRVLIVV